MPIYIGSLVKSKYCAARQLLPESPDTHHFGAVIGILVFQFPTVTSIVSLCCYPYMLAVWIATRSGYFYKIQGLITR